MRKFIYVSALILAAGFTRLWPAPFEGKVVYRISGKAEVLYTDAAMTFYLKGPKVRVDVKNYLSYTLADYRAHTMVTVRPISKSYINIPWTLGKEQAPAGWTFNKTGNTQFILGRLCQQWIYKEKDTTSIVWAAEGIGDFNGIGSSKTWAAVLKKKKLFPLKIETTSQNTAFEANNSIMEAIQLEQRPLDDSIFSVPQGYKTK